MNNELSYYHPSTVVFVDDQQAFLSAIKNKLPQESLALFFNHPEEALKYLIANSFTQNNRPTHLYEVEDSLERDFQNHNEVSLNLRLGDVCKTVYNSKRFSEISVIIVDRLMPNLDGINFCRMLSEHPAKKIMLTASKDHTVAIKAFNEGIIDFFLLKDSPNLIAQLLEAIGNMQRNYFLSLSKRTLGASLELAAPLMTEVTVNFIRNKMETLEAVEFYLLDREGSTLLLKYDGTPITLVISSGNTMDQYAVIAQEHEEQTIAATLSQRKKLLFFPNEMDCMRPVREWNDFLFEASQIPGTVDLFYTLIEGSYHQSIEVDKIHSQKNYIF